jgi:hypothetical protein
VWLTSVGAAPVLFLLAMFYQEDNYKVNIVQSLNNGMHMYVPMALCELISSSPVCLVFSGFISLILLLPFRPGFKRWLMFVCGIGLTVGLFLFILQLLGCSADIFSREDITLLISNCACIGWGVWFYDLEPVVPQEEIISG